MASDPVQRARGPGRHEARVARAEWRPPTIDCQHANYGPNYPTMTCQNGTDAVGSETTLGDGRWGQADMAGNAWEWTLDWRLTRDVDRGMAT